MPTDDQAPATGAEALSPTMCGIDVRIIGPAWRAWREKEDNPTIMTDPITAFAAGFAAGLAHADPAQMRAMTEILSELRDNRDYPAGERYVTLNARVWDDWQARIAALLHPKEAP